MRARKRCTELTQELGSDRDLDQLRRLLTPVLDHIAALSDEELPGGDAASLQVR